MLDTIFQRTATGRLVRWHRTQIRELLPTPGAGVALPDGAHADEKYLEERIAEEPSLLGVTSDDSDIEGPFQSFTQIPLRAPNGRTIYPDVVVLAQSGHVLIVEVKLADNRELKDRQVVAQVLEYAASFMDCTEDSLCALFAGGSPSASWAERVQQLFPEARDPERLARRLLAKFQAGDVHLFIACDQVPPGLRELVRNMRGQAALGDFQFKVVEIVPYVREGGDGVMFVPHITFTTEIVGRTAVKVSIAEGQPRPTVAVAVTPLDEVEDKLRDIETRPNGKWTAESFFADAAAKLSEDTVEALRRAYQRASANAQVRWGTGAKNASLKVYFPQLSSGNAYSFSTDGKLWLGLSNLPEDVAAGIRDDLKGLGLRVESDGAGIKETDWKPRLTSILEVFERHAAAACGTAR